MSPSLKNSLGSRCARLCRDLGQVLLIGLLFGCGMTKQEVREELLLLEKNRPIRDAGVETVSLSLDLGEGPVTFDVPYLHQKPKGGADDQPPVLLIHGTPSTLFTWVHVVFGGEDATGRTFSGLADQFEILAPDFPGHGSTAPAAGPYTFDKLVAFAMAFLDALDIEEVIVVGHSYGGEVAWRLAHKHPTRVARLVLMDASGYRRPRWEVPIEEIILKEHPLARWGGLATSLEDVEEALEISFVHGVPADEARENYFLVKNDDNWEAMIDLAKEEEGLAEATIGSIRQPTLLLWGSEDGNFPVALHAHRFANDIEDSSLVLIPECGHYPQVEKPAAVVSAIAEFLARP